MRRSNILAGSGRVLTVLLFAAAAFAAVIPAVQSGGLASPVRLDGKADEWTDVPRVADLKAGTEFAFQNDGRNLYVLVLIKDPEAGRAIGATGMVILGRPDGKRKQAKGALFMGRVISADGYIAWRESQGAVLTDADKDAIRKTPRHPIAVAFAIDAKGSSYGPLRKQTDVFPPDFSSSVSEAGAVYEFRIPLASPDTVPGGIGGVAGSPIRIWFEWGGTTGGSLSTESGRKIPTNGTGSGYLSGTGRTWGQEYLDNFDQMSRPSLNTKKYTFAVDVTLAGAR